MSYGNTSGGHFPHNQVIECSISESVSRPLQPYWAKAGALALINSNPNHGHGTYALTEAEEEVLNTVPSVHLEEYLRGRVDYYQDMAGQLDQSKVGVDDHYNALVSTKAFLQGHLAANFPA